MLYKDRNLVHIGNSWDMDYFFGCDFLSVDLALSYILTIAHDQNATWSEKSR